MTTCTSEFIPQNGDRDRLETEALNRVRFGESLQP